MNLDTIWARGLTTIGLAIMAVACSGLHVAASDHRGRHLFSEIKSTNGQYHRPKIALLVAHSPSKPGFYSPHLQTTEYAFNLKFARALAAQITQVGGEAMVFTNTDEESKKIIAKHISSYRPALTIEMHLNAGVAASARGAEVAVLRSASKETVQVAQALHWATINALHIPSRGVTRHQASRPRWASAKLLPERTLVYSPIFVSNQQDVRAIKEKYLLLVRKVADALVSEARNPER